MTPGSGTVVDPRMTLAMWLRDGRARKKLTIDDVARITKIQVRILEKLETGQLDGLPAEVFVKGFVRSFARCVGLDESEALDRYLACKTAPVARALVESMSELAPVVARGSVTRPMQAAEIIEVAQPVSEVSIAPPEITEVVPPVSEVALVLPPVETSATDLPIVDISISDLPAITSSAEIPVAPAANQKKRRSRKKAADAAPGEMPAKRTRSRKKKIALGTPAEPTPVVAAPADAVTAEPAVEAAPVAEAAAVVEAAPVAEAAAVVEPPVVSESSPAQAMELEVAAVVDAASGPIEIALDEPALDTTLTAQVADAAHGTWKPTMPPLAATASVSWRRPSLPAASLPVTPSLVIDDADPDRAEREQEERATLREPHKVSFLPPILLDREDKSARQGGLTLAVIILLIAATLTLSYLMRRPSVSGDGVTMRETPATLANG